MTVRRKVLVSRCHVLDRPSSSDLSLASPSSMSGTIDDFGSPNKLRAPKEPR